MTAMLATSHVKMGRPFEEDGTFGIDKGSKEDRRPRRLFFRTHDNFIGYSSFFRRKEAYEGAMAARSRSKFAETQNTQARTCQPVAAAN